MRTPWPHQSLGFTQLVAALLAGERRTCVTSPTGGGKSELMRMLINWAGEMKWPVVLYTNRKLLLEQTIDGLETAGIDHGIRASGYEPALLRDVQISSIQTEQQRVYKQQRWELHKARLVLVDEAHVQKGAVADKVLKQHVEEGAAIVGFTATPLEIGHLYDKLIIAGTNSELRACGAHVVCQTYGPDEPDLSNIGQVKVGEDLTENQTREAIMRPGIFGRVYDWWQRLNPDARPAILFAPGVAESIWFAEQFTAKGVKVAHIDGDDIWVDGKSYPSTPDGRAAIIEGSKLGDIKVICNRFVMREAVDLPWLYHGIGATVFGALTSFLQSGGRLLRAHPTLDHVIWQDHGGSWWRHGSLNSDREWRLEYTNAMCAKMHAERCREKKQTEPIVCPECGKVRMAGPVCNACGHRSERKSRRVVQKDGSLKEMQGDVFKERKVKEAPNTLDLWRQIFWRARKSKKGMTFNQAIGLFFHEHHYWPPRTLELMPKSELDWHRKVGQVPFSELVQGPPRQLKEQPLFEGKQP